MSDWKKSEMSPTWDYKTDKEVQGVLTNVETSVGPNNSMLYTLEQTSGKMINIWGSTVLDVRFRNIKMGEEVKVEYLGMVKNEKSGRSYHNFEVYHREFEAPVTDNKEEVVTDKQLEEAEKIFGNK